MDNSAPRFGMETLVVTDKVSVAIEEFPTSARLEARLAAERRIVFSTHVCPDCGVRLSQLGARTPMPSAVIGLLSCPNALCRPHGPLYRVAGIELIPVSRDILKGNQGPQAPTSGGTVH